MPYWSQQAQFDPHISEVNDIDNAIDLTGSHDATNLLADFENTEVPAVVIKKKKRTSARNKNTLGVSTQCSNRRDSDLIESESLLLKKIMYIFIQ